MYLKMPFFIHLKQTFPFMYFTKVLTKFNENERKQKYLPLNAVKLPIIFSKSTLIKRNKV